MRDLRFITLTDAIPVVAISEVPTSDSSRMLRLVTDGGVEYTSRVYINDLGIDTFTVTSTRVLLVTLPSVLGSIDISEMDVSISSSRRTSTLEPVELNFGTTKAIGSVEGIEKLVQQVVKSLLSNSGSNRYSTMEGGDLLKGLSGAELTPSGRSKVASIIQSAVTQTQSDIVLNQTSQRMPSDERLLSLELVGVDFDDLSQTASARVKLTTYAGSSYSIPLAL